MELKLNGYARPVEYESASVLFTDFVGFTRLAENSIASQVTSWKTKCITNNKIIRGNYYKEVPCSISEPENMTSYFHFKCEPKVLGETRPQCGGWSINEAKKNTISLASL